MTGESIPWLTSDLHTNAKKKSLENEEKKTGFRSKVIEKWLSPLQLKVAKDGSFDRNTEVV